MTKTKMVIILNRMEKLERKVNRLIRRLEDPKFGNKVMIAYLKAKEIKLII